MHPSTNFPHWKEEVRHFLSQSLIALHFAKLDFSLRMFRRILVYVRKSGKTSDSSI